MRKILMYVILLCNFSLVSVSQVAELTLSDDTVSSSLNTLIQKLKKVSKEENLDRLYDLSCDTVKIFLSQDMGEELSKEEMRVYLGEIDSFFWRELKRVIEIRGTLKDSSYVIPFTIDSFQDLVENNEYLQKDFIPLLAVVSDSVKIYSKPDTLSEILRLTSFEVYKPVPDLHTSWDKDINDYSWKAIQLSDKTGYLKSEYVFANSGYYIILRKTKSGCWCFNTFTFKGS